MKLKEPQFQRTQLSHVDKMIAMLTDQPMSVTCDFLGDVISDVESAVTNAATDVASAVTDAATDVASAVTSAVSDVTSFTDSHKTVVSVATEAATVATDVAEVAAEGAAAVAIAIRPAKVRGNIAMKLRGKGFTGELSLKNLIMIRKEALN